MIDKQQKQQRCSSLDLSSSPARSTMSDASKMGLMHVTHSDALFISEADPFMTDKSPVLSSPSSMPSPITTSYDSSSSSTPLTSSPKSTFLMSSPTSSTYDNQRQQHHHRSLSHRSSIPNKNNTDDSSISCHTNMLLDDETYFQLSEYLAQSSPFDNDNSTTATTSSFDDHNRLSLTESSSPAAAAAAPGLNMDGLQIRVIGAPDKSRVETQTRLCIQLLTANGTKVSSWPYLKLPEQLLARSRLKRSAQRSSSSSSSSSTPTSPSSPTATLLANDGRMLLPDESSKIVYLDAKVVCASQPDQPVKVCSGCIQRERKRAERSKNGANQHKNNNSDRPRLIIDDIPEQDRILLFNCGPMVNFGSGDAILPTRITCYCRHHNEKVGFCVQFTMKTDNGDIIAMGMSPPILITDDHKSTRQKSRKRDRNNFEATSSSSSSSSSDRSNSNSNNSNTNKTARRLPPSGLSTAVAPVTPAASRRGSLSVAAAMENLPPLETADPNDLSILDNGTTTTITTRFDSTSLPTPGEERNPFGNPLSFFPPTTTTTTTTVSAPSLAGALHHAVVPPPPSSSSSSSSSSASSTTTSPVINTLEHRLLIPPPLTTMSEQYVTPENLSSTRTPQLERLVPAQGPTYGGCEVTVLGANFYRGLTCLFGEHQATTIFWNPNTLVCLLPPAAHPGPVVVSFKQHSLVLEGQDVPLFTYYDANDQALLELALQVVGLKMTGKLQDAKQIAMRIVQGGDNSSLFLHHHNNNNDNAANNNHNDAAAAAPGTSDHDTEKDDDTTTTLEDAVIQVLDKYQVTANELLHATSSSSGHTLLHLAAWLGYSRLACKILSMCHEALTVCDRNGYTPLSLAQIKGHTAIIQDMITARATIRKSTTTTTTTTVQDIMMRRSLLSPIMRRFHLLSSSLLLSPLSHPQANDRNNIKIAHWITQTTVKPDDKNCFSITLWPSPFQLIGMQV